MKSHNPEHQEYSMSDLGAKTLRMRRRLYLVSFIVVLGAILFFAGQMLNVLAIPVGVVIWTVVIVFTLSPLVNFLEKKHINRGAATGLAYLGLVVCLVLLGYLLFSPVFGFNEQFSNLMEAVPYYIDTFRTWFNDFYGEYGHYLQDYNVKDWVNEALNSILASFTSIAQSSATNIVSVGSGIVNAFLVIALALVVAFWILMEMPALGREFRRVAGPRFNDDIDMLSLVGSRVMGGYIKAMIIQCSIIGIVCGIGFFIIGVPNSAALGAIVGLCNIIPVIGAWIGCIAAGLGGIFAGPGIALAALVWSIIVQQVFFTFISPKILGDSVDVHPVLVIVGLMVGSALGTAVSGVIGALVGALVSVPLIAAAKSIFVYYFEKRTGRRIVSEDGVFFKGTPESYDTVDPMLDATAFATGKFSSKDVLAAIQKDENN